MSSTGPVEKFRTERERRRNQALQQVLDPVYSDLSVRMREQCIVEPRHLQNLTLDQDGVPLLHVSFCELCVLLNEFKPGEIEVPIIEFMHDMGENVLFQNLWTYVFTISLLPRGQPLFRVTHTNDVLGLQSMDTIFRRFTELGYSCTRVQEQLDRETDPRRKIVRDAVFVRQLLH